MTFGMESFWVGIGVSLLMATLLPCFIFLITYNPNSPADRRVGIVIGRIAVAFVLICLFAQSYFLAMCPLALAVLTSTLELKGVSVPTARRWIVVTSVAAFICVAGSWGEILWGLQSKLNQVPMISLTERLEYEVPYRTAELYPVHLLGWPLQSISPDCDRTSPASLETADGTRADGWTTAEVGFFGTSQQSNAVQNFETLSTLLRTHRSMEFQFRTAAGFGVERWYEMSYRDWELELPKRPLIPISTPNGNVPSDLSDAEMSTIAVNYEPWHTSNLINFAHPRTLGYIEWSYEATRPDLDRVVGFVPHGFASTPEAPERSGDVNVCWQMDSLQLVSLLKHRPGAVYLTSHLPNMAELKNVPTRPLDPFEATALQGLKQGEEVIVVGNDSKLRMIGAVRASFQCLECHQVPRGTLLGAFTYQFSRIKPGHPASPINKNGWHVGQSP
ncbi:MAG: hypothetical protein WCJ09_07550 [Planctomycetota bacterium]